MSNFDYHTLHAIANGLNYYKANRGAFDSLIPGVSNQYREKMFSILTTTEISFDITSLKRKANMPVITCYTKSDGIANLQPLSDIGDGAFVLHQVNMAVIYIYTQTKEQMRLYELLCKASMMLFRNSFIKAGYDNLIFVRSSDEDLEGASSKSGRDSQDTSSVLGKEDLYKKQLTYQSISSMNIKPIQTGLEEYPWEIEIDLI